jgi:hypothetical protein
MDWLIARIELCRPARRYALPAATLLAVALLASATVRGQDPQRSIPKPVELTADRQLFVDDWLVDSRTAVTRVLHPPTKAPQPVLIGDRPWEGWMVYPHGSPCVMYDREERLYKLWYQAYSISVTGGERVERYIMCYATSRDGLSWEKPELGIHEIAGSKANNVVVIGQRYWALTNVIKDERDPDPSRRYKCLSWDRPGAGQSATSGISVAFSPDGVHWQLHPGNPVLTGVGDSHNILWDTRLGKFVGYFRPGGRTSGGIRTIGFSTSDDFVHWSEPELILRPDTQDPVADEFYQMPVVEYQGKYIGFLWVYHNSPRWAGAANPPKLENVRGLQQKMDTQLTYSHDGKHFLRIGDRAVWLPTGAPGTWDEGMVEASTAIERDREIWIYYSGTGARHTFESLQTLGKIVDGRRRMGAVGLAKLRRDGWVSLRGGAEEGVVVTRQLVLKEPKQLVLNADARRGSVVVEVLDPSLDPVAGFGRVEARPLTGDAVEGVIAWSSGSDLSSLRGRTVRLRIWLKNADLYSIQFR